MRVVCCVLGGAVLRMLAEVCSDDVKVGRGNFWWARLADEVQKLLDEDVLREGFGEL